MINEKEALIDKRAIVHPSAKLANNVYVGPWSMIGPEVTLGEGTWIGPHVIVTGKTTIGRNNKIYQFSTVGEEPQHKQYAGESTTLEIGDGNVIREYCSLHRGTKEKGITRIGNDNFFMAYTHIAHDCVVHDGTILANNSTLAGHVTVESRVGFGGFACVRQFCVIGAYSFVAGATSIVKDVLPYVLVSGHHGSVYGLNIVGLKRNGFTQETIRCLKHAYHIIYQESLTVKEALAKLQAMVNECPEVQRFIDSLQNSTRGIVR